MVCDFGFHRRRHPQAVVNPTESTLRPHYPRFRSPKDRRSEALFGDFFPFFFQQLCVFPGSIEREWKLLLG